jgi:hypothetical protein
MSNPIDAFREQRAVAGEVYATPKDVEALLGSLKEQTERLMPVDELRELLAEERVWLQEAQRVVGQVRDLRANELRRIRTSRVAQCLAAVAFAVSSAMAVGAGYAWVTKPYASELSELRARQDFAELIESRFVTMTPAERRQFEVLMKFGSSQRK